MSDIVTVIHPAPIRHVPKGLRKPRVDHLAMRTPVRLREVDASAFEPVTTVRTTLEKFEYHAFEGKLWLELVGSTPGSPPRPFGRSDLVGFLDGTIPHRKWSGSDMARHFVRSPLMAATGEGVRRGGAVDVASSRRILDDLRDEAPALIGKMLGEGVALAGDRVFVRARGPLGIYGGTGFHSLAVEPFPNSWRSYGYAPCVEPSLVEEVKGYPVRMNGILAFHSAVTSIQHFWNGPDPLRDQRTMDGVGIPTELLGDEDVVLMANVLPGLAAHRVGEIANSLPDPGRRSDLLHLADTLRVQELRGTLGAFGTDDSEEVLRDVARVAYEAQAARGASPCTRLRVMTSWIERIALPRLRNPDAPVAKEDEEALSTINMTP